MFYKKFSEISISISDGEQPLALSLSNSGSKIAIGIPEYTNDEVNQGKFEIYHYSNGNWNLMGSFNRDPIEDNFLVHLCFFLEMKKLFQLLMDYFSKVLRILKFHFTDFKKIIKKQNIDIFTII